MNLKKIREADSIIKLKPPGSSKFDIATASQEAKKTSWLHKLTTLKSNNPDLIKPTLVQRVIHRHRQIEEEKKH